VVRVEDTDAEAVAGRVRILSDSDAGRNIRPRGQDMRNGQEVLPSGTTVGPGQMGLLAAAGVSGVRVHERPRVAILSNGDEIAGPHEFERVREGNAIPETNAPTLAAAVLLSGGIPVRLGVARDNAESIIEKVDLVRTGDADVLLTSGGASMGEHDLFKRVLDELGFQLKFWRVKMRPGTPFSFGWLPRKDGRTPIAVFGLPGNPASSFVTYQIFARPFLLRMGGHRHVHRRVVPARAGETLRSGENVTHFLRVVLQGNAGLPIASLTGSQTSGLVHGQGLAQGLAVVPEGVAEIREGEVLNVVLLDDLGHDGDEPGYGPG
jgi:molybdopterin molybdotransferase